MAALGVGAYFPVPWVNTVLNTVSTDDAYINGHVTSWPPSLRSGEESIGGRQRPCEERGFAAPTRQGAFPGAGGFKRAAVKVAEANLAAAESKARSLEAQLGSQRGNSRALASRSTARSRSGGSGGRTCERRKRHSTWPELTTSAASDCCRPPPSAVRTSITPSAISGRYGQCKAGPRGYPSDARGTRTSPGAKKGASPDGCTSGPESDLLRSPNRAGRLYGHDDPARTAAGIHRPDAEQGPRRVSSVRQGGRHRPHPPQSAAEGAQRASSQRRLGTGPARPGASRVEPALLRHCQRDRRRGDQPQRQSRATMSNSGKA